MNHDDHTPVETHRADDPSTDTASARTASARTASARTASARTASAGIATKSPTAGTQSGDECGTEASLAAEALPTRLCGWCDHHFPIARRPGRPRLYCNPTCRQRAYERRRGLAVLPPPDRIIMQPGGPTAHLAGRIAPGYEAGQTSISYGPTHAMRPSGISDTRGRRVTLCGTLAHPISRAFSPFLANPCRTCAIVHEARPPAQPIRLSPDLAALRAIVDQAAVEASRSARSQHAQRPAAEILRDPPPPGQRHPATGLHPLPTRSLTSRLSAPNRSPVRWPPWQTRAPSRST